MEEQFEQAIMYLELMKINSPLLPNFNFNYKFAYMNLLQDMYSRDIKDPNIFSDPDFNYSNNICNQIINKINDVRQEFNFNAENSYLLVYLQTLPPNSISYISKLNSICLQTYKLDPRDSWNIKYYYMILKFIPVYFETVLGLFNTPVKIRNTYIQKFNAIFDKKIFMGIEDYTSCNFWIKDMFRTNNNKTILLLELIDMIYKDKLFIMQYNVTKTDEQIELPKKQLSKIDPPPPPPIGRNVDLPNKQSVGKYVVSLNEQLSKPNPPANKNMNLIDNKNIVDNDNLNIINKKLDN